MKLNLNGYTDIPNGKMIAVVSNLQLFTKLETAIAANPLIKIINNPNISEYLKLYRTIGEPWLWFSRLQKSKSELEAILNDENYELYYMGDFGLLELDYRVKSECEIAYFGLTPDKTGQGHGDDLMRFAINQAFKRNIKRLWVHTCTLDHPKALGFYQKYGFEIYSRQLEIDDDPRHTGLIAPHFGAHFKML